MMKKLKYLLSSLSVMIAMLSLVTVPAMLTSPVVAAPVDVLQKCNDESKVCQGTDESTLTNLIKNIINLLLTVIGIISVIMIIIGGIKYTTSAGDSSQINSARDTIIYAVVGLVIAIMSFAIVNFVLGKI